MIEINIIYGLILAILTLVLGERFLFSIKESRDGFLYTLIPQSSISISRSISLVTENISSNLGRFSRFKLTIRRRQFLKALFLDFSPCHK